MLRPATNTEDAERMYPAYLGTRCRCPAPPDAWPRYFAIITAFATTGETWESTRQHEADTRLLRALATLTDQVWRVHGYSPLTGHEEPGWAACLTLDVACDIGREFLQDAIYYVRDDQVWVTHCDTRCHLVPIGRWADRLGVEGG